MTDTKSMCVSHHIFIQSIITLTILYCSLDPLPPSEVEVTNTTTTSVTIQWKYTNNEASPIVKWRVVHREAGKNDTYESSTNAVDDREMTIKNLKAGMTYVISVYAVSAGDISSCAAPYVTATLGKFTNIVYLQFG